jgi:FkbM family methyltransferase
MPSLAKSPLAPILGQRVPLRGPARLLFRSYAKAPCLLGVSVRRLTSKLGDDFDIDLSSFLEWQLWVFGSYEEHFAELFSYLVAPGDRCIDVGANVGVHTIRLAKLVGADGEVIGIEPNEEAARRAVSNLALNQVANARVVHAAATDQSGGYVELYLPGTQDTNRARASVLPHDYLTGSVAKVPTVSIDDLCSGPVALIKIDVEGHEGAVVTGAAATIDRCFPTIVFEYAPQLLRNPAQSPFSWLAGRGYEMLRVRHERHSLTGRGRLVLDHLQELPGGRDLPDGGWDILAIPAAKLPQVDFLVRG